MSGYVAGHSLKIAGAWYGSGTELPDEALGTISDEEFESLIESGAIIEEIDEDDDHFEEELEDEPVNATPGAIELAEEAAIELAEVDGTGDGGRIKKSDVEAAIDARDVAE